MVVLHMGLQFYCRVHLFASFYVLNLANVKSTTCALSIYFIFHSVRNMPMKVNDTFGKSVFSLTPKRYPHLSIIFVKIKMNLYSVERIPCF